MLLYRARVDQPLFIGLGLTHFDNQLARRYAQRAAPQHYGLFHAVGRGHAELHALLSHLFGQFGAGAFDVVIGGFARGGVDNLKRRAVFDRAERRVRLPCVEHQYHALAGKARVIAQAVYQLVAGLVERAAARKLRPCAQDVIPVDEQNAFHFSPHARYARRTSARPPPPTR